jgi:choline-glycine betaine transporter
MRFVSVILVVLFALSGPASAYVGPGLGLGIFSSLMSLCAGIFLLFLGFIYYPIKKLVRSLRKTNAPSDIKK